MLQNGPAAWYADPFGRHELRYWDGGRWTEHVTSKGVRSSDPPLDSLPVLADLQPPAGWHPDPSARHELRYWDGKQWTDQVNSGGHQAVDPLVEQAVRPVDSRASKKVVRQVRKAGAGDDQTGGGTLLTEQVLVVNQKAKVIGSRREYAVFASTGRQLGKVQELGRDLTTMLGDSLLRTEDRREHRFQLVDMTGQVVVAMTGPKMGTFTMRGTLRVDGPNGAPIGQIVFESFGSMGSAASAASAGLGMARRLPGAGHASIEKTLSSAEAGLDRVGYARFGLEAGGQRIGSINAEDARKWDFNVQDADGTQIARITKTWAGWAKERFHEGRQLRLGDAPPH